VDFVKNQESLAGRDFTAQQRRPGVRVIPVQVARVTFIPCAEQAESQGRFSHLPGPGDEDHFFLQIFTDRGAEVPLPCPGPHE
jgi:hypothetical protein